MRSHSRKAVPSATRRDVTEAVGRVPIVRLNRLGGACREHEQCLKLESCNPGGTIIESSSGSFGYLWSSSEAERVPNADFR